MAFPTDRKGKGKSAAKTAAGAAPRQSIAELTPHAGDGNEGVAMRKSKRTSTQVLEAQDALSLDDLDRVVGGTGTEGQNREGQYVEGGYQPPPPPVVTAPANLPDPIHQIETQVTNHTITADQAVTQIAGIIGNAPDHSMQSIAGAEIASLVGRGLLDANTAITDLHTAVTQSHSLTGDQAAGVLAGMMLAQSLTPGESATIVTTAHAELGALVSAGALTADHALTAIASVAGSQYQSGGFSLISEMTTFANQNSMTPAQIAADISATVDNHDVTGTTAVSLLTSMADRYGGMDIVHAAGHEIAELVAHHGVSVADAIAGVDAVSFSTEYTVIPLLATAGTENHDLLAPAGTEIAHMLGSDPYFWTQARNQFEGLVANGSLSLDNAITMLVAAAAGDPQHGVNAQSGWASQVAVDLITQRHFDAAVVMADIESAVTAGHASADGAVALLTGIAMNGGYGASLAPQAETELVAMINHGVVSATQAANDIANALLPSAATGASSYSTFYSHQALAMLASIGQVGTPEAEAAVVAALTTIANQAGNSPQGLTAGYLVSSLGLAVGSGGAALDTAIAHEISALVAAGTISANDAIIALGDAVAETHRTAAKPAICNEIAALAATGQIPPAQVMADLLTASPSGLEFESAVAMAMLSGRGSDWQAAASSELVAMVTTGRLDAGSVIWAVQFAVTQVNLMPADQGIGLLAAAVGDGTTPIHADAVGVSIAAMISGGRINATDAMGAVHAAITGGRLNVDAAVSMLANIAAQNATAAIAVNTELRALILGNLISAGHAGDVLNDLAAAAAAAGNTALQSAINAELAVVSSSDPASAVFGGIDANTSATQLAGAADQLYSLVHTGQMSIASLMHDIDQALQTNALTPAQAISLLVGLAGHNEVALQSAAGTELAAVIVAGNLPFGQISIPLATAIDSGALTPEAAAIMLLPIIGSSSVTEAVRTVARDALAEVMNSGFIIGNRYVTMPVTQADVNAAVHDMLAAHTLSGAQALRAAFVMTGTPGAAGSWGNLELPALINTGSVTPGDVHIAVASGWIESNYAVTMLARLSTDDAVTEIISLINGGTVSLTQVLTDIRSGIVPGAATYGGVTVTFDQYARVADAIMNANPSSIPAVAGELLGAINNGQLSGAHLGSLVAGAGAAESALTDQLLGAVATSTPSGAGILVGALVNANATTLDHVIAQLATQPDALVNALEYAVIQNALDATQVLNACMAAASNGSLTSAQIKTIAVDMADTGVNAMANTAGAMLAAAVSSGGMSAQEAMAELTNNANRYAHVLQGAAPGIGIPSMMMVLNSFVAHCNPGDVPAACQEVMTLVSYSFFTPDVGAQMLIGFADHTSAASINQIGGFFSYQISQGQQSLYSVESLINQSIAAGSLTGQHAMSIYAGIAEGAATHGAAQSQTMNDALGQITALMQGGQGTPQDAFAALCAVAGNVNASLYPPLTQAVGAQMNTLVTANPAALAGMGDAITGQTLTSAQAANLLLGMLQNYGALPDMLAMSQGVPTAVIAEANTLISGHLMASSDFLRSIGNALSATTLSPDAAVSILANCWPNADASFAPQIAGTLITMMQGGQITPDRVVYDLNGTFNHPLTVDQTIGLMTAISSPNTQLGTAVSSAVAADLVQLMQGPALLGGNAHASSVDVVVNAIHHAVTDHGVDAASAVALLAQLANSTMGAQGTLWLMSAAAAQEIVSLIGSNQIGAGAALSYVAAATAGASDHGVVFMMDIAAHSNTACQIAFGSIIANLVGNGTMTASQAVGYVSSAYAAYAQNPTLQDSVHISGPSYRVFQPGNVTAQQELGLLAGILAGMASPGHLDATSLITPVHNELLAAMNTPPYRAVDTQVVAALQEVGLSGGPILAAANAEITRLEADPKVLIDVAAQTGLNMSDVGSQLATLISQGTLTVGEAMGDILSANSLHNLSNDQALTMIVSAVAHAATAGIYLQQQTTSYANNWLYQTSAALERLAQNGMSPDAIGAAFHGVIGQGVGLLMPGDAVAVLASTAAYADLQGMAATQIAAVMANASFNQYPHQVAYEVAGCVHAAGGPGFLDATAAVQLLAHVAAMADTPAAYGGIALGLGDQASAAQISPDTVANAVMAMVQSHSLTGEQALHFLAPYGANGPGTIGHAIGTLIASNQVSMADFTALVYGGLLQSSTQIQNTSYWQQVAGTGNVDFNSAIVMLAAMTSQTNAAVTQLAQIAAADTGFVWSTIETRILDAGQHPDTSGLNPREAVRALTILATDHSPAITVDLVARLADDIGRLVSPAMSYGAAVAEVAGLTANGDPAVSQGAMAILNVLVGQTGAYGNDGIVAAVGHGITADQAITILTDLSVTQTSNMQQHVRADIAYLIAQNQITAAQAFADVHAECLARGISASGELSIYAGVIGSGGTSPALESAAADAIVGMVSSGRLSLGQVMDGLAQGTMISCYYTQAQALPAYLAGGLSISNSASLMAVVAAHSADPSAFAVAAAELAGMLGSYSATDRPSVMAGVDAAVSSGLLSAQQAVVLLASAPLGATDDAKAAMGGEFTALISGGLISVGQAVSAIEAMAHNGTAMQQMQAGAAISLLVAQNQLTPADAISGIASAIANNALTPDQAVSVLAGMSAGGSAALSNAAAAEIMTLIANNSETGAQALSLLINAAEHGTGAMLAGLGVMVDALISGHAVTATQAIQSIDAAFNSGALSTPAATTLLVDMGRTTDASIQAAVGHEIAAIIQHSSAPNSAIAALGQQLAANVSQDQAVVLLAAAVAGAGVTIQTPLAALIVSMINTGPIGIAQVLSDIDAAVTSQGLPASQALVALAHLEEAIPPGGPRLAVVNEVTALVSNGQIPAADAAQTLLGVVHGGSTALQSLVGGMLASLADHNLLTNQQVVDAITHATSIATTETLGVLMGMGVNGNAAAQAASGAGFLALIQSGRTDPQTVIALIDDQARHNGITPEHAVQVLLNISGAAIGELNAGVTGITGGYDRLIRDQMLGEVVSLVQSAQFFSGGAHATLLSVAGQSIALAEAVGRCCAFLGTNAAVIGGSDLAAAVNAGRMTGDEAMMVALTSSMSLQAQGQFTFLSFVQSSGMNIDQVIHFLAVTAARTGDSDPNLPYYAYTGSAGPDRDMMNAAFADMVALVQGIPGIGPVTSSATLINDVLAAGTSHDLTGLQCASMLAVLAGKLGGTDALLAANAIGSLVTQGLITNENALHSIAWAGSAGLTTDLANVMYADMALSTDPNVRQIAMWHFNATNLGTETLAHAFHAVTTNPVFTHDQALAIICNVAPGILDGSQFTASFVAATLAAEITAMVTSHQITADHALAVLAADAASSGFHLNALGTELAALVTAGAISFDRAMNDLAAGGLNADQQVTVLARMCVLNHSWDSQIVSRISSMVAAGTISAGQAMADLGAVHNQIVQEASSRGQYVNGFALELLAAFVNAGPALEAAAAAECATLIAQGTLNGSILWSYATTHFDVVHAYGWIVSVASYGNADLQNYVDSQLNWNFSSRGSDLTTYLTSFLVLGCAPHIQYYIGQVLGRFVDHTPTQATNVVDAFDLRITGTALANEMAKDATQAAKNAHTSLDSLLPTKVNSDTAAMVLLGLSNTTHNAQVLARANDDQVLVSKTVDAQFVANIAQALPPEQALTQFANIVQHGWANTALVAKQIADMVAAGTVTATQVLASFSTLDTNHQLALVTDILALHETGSSAFVSQFATLTLLTWGVAPTSQTYTQLHDAITQAVPDFVGLVRGTTTAQQAMSDLRGIATAHNLSVDVLLLATYQAAAQDPSIGAASLTGALSTIGHEIYTHLTDGSAAHAVAGMVLGGAMSESAAATLMQELAACATIPPNDIMSQVASGNMSVWYADAHHPGWSSTAGELQFTGTQAVAMLHVDVHVAQDAAAVLAGTMSAQDAVDDVLAVGSASEYAKDLGLLGLAHALDHAPQLAQDTVGLALTARVASGASESMLVTMANHGWLSGQSAVDLLEAEIRVATAGVSADAAVAFETVALARLDLQASGQVDPNATIAQQQAHAHATSSAIQSVLEGSLAAKVLSGLGALQTVGNDTYLHGAGFALAQHMMGVVVSQLAEQPNAASSSTAALPDWAHSLPPAVQQTMHYADIATEIFTLGIGTAGLLNVLADHYAPTVIANALEHPVSTVVQLGHDHGADLLSLAVQKYAPATDIAALTTNVASVQTWVDLGVDCAVNGVPLAGTLGLPSPLGGIQANMLNEMLGEGASETFLAVNIGSKVCLAALEMGVVQNWLDDHPAVKLIAGPMHGALGVLSESCSLISGVISGTIHTYANQLLAAGTETFNTFKDIFTGHDASGDAEQLGKQLFLMFTGASFDSVQQVGEDVGRAMVDIFSGHPQNLGGDLEALGKDSLHMIASNPYLQMASNAAYTYLQRIDDYLGHPERAYTSDGLKGFLGLPHDVSWDTMLTTTFQDLGGKIDDGFKDVGNKIADGIRGIF